MTPLSLDDTIAGVYKGSSYELLSKIPQDVDYPRYVVVDLARYYRSWGVRFGIRADVAWAQMLLETGDLRFGGQVSMSAHNFCGLKTTDGAAFARFRTVEAGVIAHMAHLACYAFPEHVRTECSDQYDPRHTTPHHNWATTIADLSGKWAPTEDYAGKIVRRWNG